MSLTQLMSNSTNGEGFAHVMMQERDLLEVKRAAGLNMTAVSNYFFANISSWLGVRAAFRNGLLELWMPNAAMLAAHFTRTDPARVTADPTVVKSALERLRQLQKLCASYGASFVMLVPPTVNRFDAGPAVAAAGAGEGIRVLIPYPPAELSAAEFADGFHLNPEGAALFTTRLATELPSLLDKSPPPLAGYKRPAP